MENRGNWTREEGKVGHKKSNISDQKKKKKEVQYLLLGYLILMIYEYRLISLSLSKITWNARVKYHTVVTTAILYSCRVMTLLRDITVKSIIMPNMQVRMNYPYLKPSADIYSSIWMCCVRTKCLEDKINR